MGFISSKEFYSNYCIREYHIFPHGTIYEKELNSNFKYFNIFWYDPMNSNDLFNFVKCFENVQFYKGYGLEATLSFFEKESSSEWIVITSSYKREELLKNLEKFECIKSFFIYCPNPEFHEKWAKKIKKVGCITSNPEVLCEKLIEINKKYLIPDFKYKNGIKKNILFDLRIVSQNKFAMKSVNRQIEEAKRLEERNLYSKFCIKSLQYLSGDNYEKDFKEPVEDENTFYT